MYVERDIGFLKKFNLFRSYSYYISRLSINRDDENDTYYYYYYNINKGCEVRNYEAHNRQTQTPIHKIDDK